MKQILKKIFAFKLALFGLLFSVSLVYAAVKNADGIWQVNPGDPISSTNINENFNTLMGLIKDLQKNQVPSKAIMPFYSNCPANWVIADGSNGTPDLRGQFLRGLNDFGSGIRNDGKQDPNGEGRTLGSWQGDELKSHNHNHNTFAGIHYVYGSSGAHNGRWIDVATGTTTSTGGSETRSKNVGLIFCMKQ
ncbi:MAG: hypothetical protein CVV50_01540 [Spirochaetae bacterium HGW-Spirochaetae-6]|jgi:hypothetical protein|nr:MAG: hypothetical protein CVV50_01540 [Spirochaetae bacterium HGW-Spirochaetae-6]